AWSPTRSATASARPDSVNPSRLTGRPPCAAAPAPRGRRPVVAPFPGPNDRTPQSSEGLLMQKLVEGIHQFQVNIFREQAELSRRLAAAGQQPQALFITCCDSRILPHQITQAQPGDLFIMRTLGNVVPPHGASTGGEAAIVEYALTVLGVKDVI